MPVAGDCRSQMNNIFTPRCECVCEVGRGEGEGGAGKCTAQRCLVSEQRCIPAHLIRRYTSTGQIHIANYVRPTFVAVRSGGAAAFEVGRGRGPSTVTSRDCSWPLGRVLIYSTDRPGGVGPPRSVALSSEYASCIPHWRVPSPDAR